MPGHIAAPSTALVKTDNFAAFVSIAHKRGEVLAPDAIQPRRIHDVLF